MSTPPLLPVGANLYGTSGATPSNSLNSAIRATRAPASTDTRGPQGNLTVGQRWIDTSANATYTLTSFSASNGIVSATWITDGGGSGALATLSGDTGTATPSGGNIQIAGGAGITTSASGAVVTVALTGGSTAIDSFVPDAGTNPVVPTALGAVTMAGTANQITTTGGTNSLTFSVPSAFIAPGSIVATTTVASTTTMTAGTGLTATTGNISATTGNVSAGAAVSATTTVTAGTGITATTGNITASAGNVVINGAGKFLAIHTGAATDFLGTLTLTSGTVTVSNTNIATGDIILLTRIATNASTTLGMETYTISNGVNFVVTAKIIGTPASTQTGDASTFGYIIVRPV